MEIIKLRESKGIKSFPSFSFQEVILSRQACSGVKSRLSSERVVHFPESCNVHEERYRALDLFRWRREDRKNLTTAFQYIRKGFQQDGARLLTEVCSQTARGHGHKSKLGSFQPETSQTKQ